MEALHASKNEIAEEVTRLQHEAEAYHGVRAEEMDNVRLIKNLRQTIAAQESLLDEKEAQLVKKSQEVTSLADQMSHLRQELEICRANRPIGLPHLFPLLLVLLFVLLLFLLNSHQGPVLNCNSLCRSRTTSRSK